MQSNNEIVASEASSVFDDLYKCGLATRATAEVLSESTRDRERVTVIRDRVSKVIYIPEHYVGNDEYIDGSYRSAGFDKKHRSLESRSDLRRRIDTLAQYYTGKKCIDFGCGHGDFLRAVKSRSKIVTGVEIEENLVEDLRQGGIECFKSLTDVACADYDTAFLFHSFEHIPSPIKLLKALRSILTRGGYIIIEVPSANDILLNQLRTDEFAAFTLWSQHLILHTPESLTRFLVTAGFHSPIVKQVQRYSLSNHLGWLLNRRPGGHQLPLSLFETMELRTSYEASLASIGACDTLVAVAIA